MVKFTLRKMAWGCPSCGVPLVLFISEAMGVARKSKWIKSSGLKWPHEMEVGGEIAGKCECSLCRTEFEWEDIVPLATITDGLPFGKEPNGEKPNEKSDS